MALCRLLAAGCGLVTASGGTTRLLLPHIQQAVTSTATLQDHAPLHLVLLELRRREVYELLWRGHHEHGRAGVHPRLEQRLERVSRSIRRRSSVAETSSATARSQHMTSSRGQPRAQGNARPVAAGLAARLVSAGPSCAISVSVSAAATGSEGEGSASSVGGGGPRPLAAADPPDDEPPRAGHFPPRGALMPGLRLCELVCAGVAPRALLPRTAPRLRAHCALTCAQCAPFCAQCAAHCALFCAHRPPFSHCENRTANPVFALPPRSARAHIALPPRSAIAEPAQCEPTGAHWAGMPSHCRAPEQCEIFPRSANALGWCVTLGWCGGPSYIFRRYDRRLLSRAP